MSDDIRQFLNCGLPFLLGFVCLFWLCNGLSNEWEKRERTYFVSYHFYMENGGMGSGFCYATLRKDIRNQEDLKELSKYLCDQCEKEQGITLKRDGLGCGVAILYFKEQP